MPAPSPAQQVFWNGPAGQQWVISQDMLDIMLAPPTGPAMDALGDMRGRSVVDIGCGAGTTTLTLAERGASPALGADISAPLIAYAQTRATAAGSPARFIEADAGAASLPDAPYDALFSRFGVMFFEQPEAAFMHLRAQLKPGGALAFVCWRGADENVWNLVPLQAVGPLLPSIPAIDPNAPGPMALANPDRTRAILTAAGWRDIGFEKWDGELIVGPDVDGTAEFMTNMQASRFTAGLNIDPADVKRRIAETIKPFVASDGTVRAQSACWIVTARA